MIEKFKRLPFVAALFRMRHPSYGTCLCCGLPWASVKHHSIEMPPDENGLGSGFFPVCEYCWQNKEQSDINLAVIRLYKEWEVECSRIGSKPPYPISKMSAAAIAQRDPDLAGDRCRTCIRKCKLGLQWNEDCKHYVDNRMYNLHDK